MKQGIHPDYHLVVFEDSATGYKFISGSTATSKETVEWEDGNEYPLVRVEVTSDSHPFYTGKQGRRGSRQVQQEVRFQVNQPSLKRLTSVGRFFLLNRQRPD